MRFHWDSKFAWWYLSQRRKRALQEERLKGRFGGVVGHPFYVWFQEMGMSDVGIMAQHFIARTKHTISYEFPIIST